MMTPLSVMAVISSSSSGKPSFWIDSRVIAYRLERRGQAGEDALAVVADHGRLAVDDLARVLHLPAEGLADGLLAQADAEDRSLAREVLDERNADASLLGVQGPGETTIFTGAITSMSSIVIFVALDLDVGAELAGTDRGCR